MSAAAVKRSEAKPTREGVRARWLGLIHRTCMTQAALVELVPWGTTELGKLPEHVIEVVQAKCHELAADAARLDGTKPDREIWQHVNAELWALLRTYRRTDGKPTAPGAGGATDYALPVGSIHDETTRQQG